jgi:hypothetical protein
VSDLDGFFAWYGERYMASDVDAISGVYEAPLLAVRNGVAIHLPDRYAVHAHLSELMAAYAASGAARADLASLEVTALGTSGALATAHWHIRDDEGGLVKDFHTTYQLLRGTEGGWRILTYTNHD